MLDRFHERFQRRFIQSEELHRGFLEFDGLHVTFKIDSEIYGSETLSPSGERLTFLWDFLLWMRVWRDVDFEPHENGLLHGNVHDRCE